MEDEINKLKNENFNLNNYIVDLNESIKNIELKNQEITDDCEEKLKETKQNNLKHEEN